MTYLLNTHTLIWAITDKQSIRKLTLAGLTPEYFPKAARETGFRLLDLDGTTVASYHPLSATYHRDPFDRMLVWQAPKNNYWLISKDSNVAKYVSEGLNVIW